MGILTGGGDCPGLNAAIRAAVKSGIAKGCQLVGIIDSFNGLFERPTRTSLLGLEDVSDILDKGGTILGTHNEGSPFGEKPEENILRLREAMSELDLAGLIVIGGEGTQGIAGELAATGVPVIGIPKTIDNDLPGTDQTIGFKSCVNLVADSVMRLRSTAESHDRIMVLEVMGRDSGYIALHGGLAGGANVILIPEIPFDVKRIQKKILERKNIGRNFSVVVVSEGATEKGGEAIYKEELGGAKTLGGVGVQVAQKLHSLCDMDVRVTVLGHLQRGGSPCPEDRILATRFAVYAVDLALKKRFNRLVVLKGQQVSDTPYSEVSRFQRRKLLPSDEILRAAEAISVCLGR